ncbi:UDP-N-acetylglucosamine 1-carboxyvinyltransferase [Patescibacteria group bacterium]|nr:UDP-N-acetylglucosamine 1-carboxyvinyltransferase [Patescibacteria group bacterium]
METFLIHGGRPLSGEVAVSGAKNAALKALAATLLTDKEVELRNIPDIADVRIMCDVIRTLGMTVTERGKVLRIRRTHEGKKEVPLSLGARLRTSSMVLGPLLARYGEAVIPNPGGCRIGARPIDRHILGLTKMGAAVRYDPHDGYFHAEASRLHGVRYRFDKNTHTGTETLLLAAVLAEGETVLENAAAEVEIDDLIAFLNHMGAKIRRTKTREIVIHGVPSLNGATHSIMSDRNEEVTFALAACVTGGDIVVRNSCARHLDVFTKLLGECGGKVERVGPETTRYAAGTGYRPSHITTAPYPGFMTDWQAPWAVLMTQAHGVSTIHETVFESRFSYVAELKKLGADISFFDPPVRDPERFYNFNWADRIQGYHQGIRISGPTRLHNGILEIQDLRAGATVVLAALAAEGESMVRGVEQIDRGYEHIEIRLRKLGAGITRRKEDV